MGFTLTTLYGVLSWGILVHSQETNPGESNIRTCNDDYMDAMDAVEQDWNNNLQSLIDQEIPASEMVADAYESMRTYNCWLEYICKAVEFSGHAQKDSVTPGANGVSTGLRSEHIGTVPGCQAPEDMRMGKEWNSFISKMSDTPTIGKINFFPLCMTDGNNNDSPNISLIAENYKQCKQALELRFGCPPGYPDILCTETSNAFVKIDNILKKTHADQKASALERKLGEIVPKLQTMETHVTYLSNFLQNLNSRLACFAAKCI